MTTPMRGFGGKSSADFVTDRTVASRKVKALTRSAAEVTCANATTWQLLEYGRPRIFRMTLCTCVLAGEGLGLQIEIDAQQAIDVNDCGHIRKVCQQFVALCRGLDLLDASIVAIDGSKFKAVNAKTRSFTREKARRTAGTLRG